MACVAAAPPSKLRCVLAHHVYARRKELGLGQEELADRAGVHRTFVGHTENARTIVSIDNVARISAVLEIEPGSVVGRTLNGY